MSRLGGSLLSRILAAFLVVAVPALACAESGGQATVDTRLDTLELLEAEELEAITLDRPLYFISEKDEQISVPPDRYHVVQREEDSVIRLISKDDETAIDIPCSTTIHTDDIPVPVALSVPEKETGMHVMLLLPGGKGLEAMGLFTPMLPRGEFLPLLMPSQIHQALLKKIEALTRVRALP